eukprot:EG_transcript_11143
MQPAWIPIWAPLAGALIALLTVVTCYCLSREYLPDSLTVPFISLMAIHPPARWVYAVGFLLVAVLWVIAAGAIRLELATYDDGNSRCWRYDLPIGYWTSLLSAGCLCVQGLIPLQSDILDVIIKPSEGTVITAQSIIHQSAAGVLFFASLVNQCCMLRFYWRSHRLRSALARVFPVTVAMKAGTFLGAVASIVFSIVWHPASGGASAGLARMQWGAALQWLFVAAIIVNFASYTPDLWALQRRGRDMEAIPEA